MDESREIAKNPVPPALSDRLIQQLTHLCFRQDDQVESADMIFVFATLIEQQKLANLINGLLIANVAPKVFLTGGLATYQGTEAGQKTECDRLLEHVSPSQYPQVEFYTEKVSSNSLSNVSEAIKVMDFTDFKSLVFIAKSHAAGRSYLTLRRFLPGCSLLQQSLSVEYPDSGTDLNRDNWHQTDFGRQRVWGEYLRIKKYGQRGDIAYQEVAPFIQDIEASLLELNVVLDTN